MTTTTTDSDLAPALDSIPSIPVVLTPGWGDWVHARDAHTAVIGWGLAVEMGLARPAQPAPAEVVEPADAEPAETGVGS